jgi:hypothetical protein
MSLIENNTYVPRLAIALVHYPIFDRLKKVVATNITNFDIHDIARAATVYGAERYYIIHPAREQQAFVHRILDHWSTGQGASFNPKRRAALKCVSTADSIEAAIQDWGVPDCLRVATHARSFDGVQNYTFPELRTALHIEKKPCLLIFGTGFGLTDDFMKSCTGVLEGIRGAPPEDYRHLSVRSAVSICLDRVMGPW